MPKFGSAPRFVFRASDGPGPGAYDPMLAKGYKAPPSKSTYLTDGHSLTSSTSSIMTLSYDATGLLSPCARAPATRRHQPRWSNDVPCDAADQAVADCGAADQGGETDTLGSPSSWSDTPSETVPSVGSPASRLTQDFMTAIARRDSRLARQSLIIAELQAKLRGMEGGGTSAVLDAAAEEADRSYAPSTSGANQVLQASRVECEALQASLHIKQEQIRQIECGPCLPHHPPALMPEEVVEVLPAVVDSPPGLAAAPAVSVAWQAAQVDLAGQQALVRVASLQDELQAVTSTADALAAQVEVHRTAIAERDVIIARQSRRMVSLLADVQTLEVMVAAAHAELAFERHRAAVLQDQLGEATRSLEAQRASANGWRDGLQLQAAAAEHDAAQERCAALEASVERLQLELLGHVKRDVAGQDKCVSLESRLASLQHELLGHVKARTELEGEVLALRRREAQRIAAAAASAAQEDAKAEEQRLRILILQRKLRVLLPTCRADAQTLENLELATAI